MAASLPSGYILHNDVRHARFLPVQSKHAFRYTTLAVLVSISALESHALDLGAGRLFGYAPAGSNLSWARITGIRPEAYLHDYSGSDVKGQNGQSLTSSDIRGKGRTLREKLEDVLERFGHDSSIFEDAWMQTMPRYMGIEFNQLTLYYCYKKGDAQLWIVIAEVHNALNERHVYVLPTGSEHEDAKIPARYDHSWTFPCQFHLSPFNDRLGYYCCSVIAPPHPPAASTAFFSPPYTPDRIPISRLPAIRFNLYTSRSPDSESTVLPSSSEELARQLKLTATLRPISMYPLVTPHVLRILAIEPFTLGLTFIRIGYQALLLHYKRRLDTFVRPEPRAINADFEKVFENGVLKGNNVQRGASGDLGTGGGVQWQSESSLESLARSIVERFIEARAQDLNIRVDLVSSNPAFPERSFPSRVLQERKSNEADLTIAYRSAAAFTYILSSPSAMHTLLVARDAEHSLAVSDDFLFLKLFSSEGGKPTYIQNLLQRMRCSPIPRSLLPSPSPTSLSKASLLLSVPEYILDCIGRWWCSISMTRFVPGDNPWDMWGRAESAWSKRSERGQMFGPGDDFGAPRYEVDWTGSVYRP